MNVWGRMKDSLSGIGQSVVRYPLTSLWFLGITIVNAMAIENTFDEYSRIIFTMLTGAFMSIAAQHVYERFFSQAVHRWMLLGGSLILTGVYYFTLPSSSVFEIVYSVRSFVLLFALFIAFIWIPTIKTQCLYFHQNFLAIFKAIFITILFSGVLSLGIAAIITSIDRLLFEIDYDAIIHSTNIIWCLFAPVYLLGLIPSYQEEQEPTNVGEAFSVPRFLSILVTYIIIPIIAIYTVILLLYLVLNISGDFWTDNLLEPMLVAYAIIGIVVYLLSCNIDHRISHLFRKVFPKIMLPIVLFQTVASILKIQEMGITHGRYYVILFGLFATAAAVIFSFFPMNRNGWIAPILLVLAVVSVTPPIDAFSVAKENQVNRLTDTLEEHDMLVNNEIVPDSSIPGEAKVKITQTVNYLSQIDYLDDVSYLPDDFSLYNQFEQVFGFQMTYSPDQSPLPSGRFASLDWEQAVVLPIEDHDYLVNYLNLYRNIEQPFEVQVAEDVRLTVLTDQPYYTLRLEDGAGQEIITTTTEPLFEKALDSSEGKDLLSVEEMTVIVENDAVRLTIIGVRLEEFNESRSVEMILLIDMKE